MGSDDIIRTLRKEWGKDSISVSGKLESISEIQPKQTLDSDAEIEARRLKIRALYWAGSKWYCKNCKQSGDKFHVVGQICNYSKNPDAKPKLNSNNKEVG